MRTITQEYLDALRESEVYRFFVETPMPDHAKLKREALAFEKWIRREHEKDRRRLGRRLRHV